MITLLFNGNFVKRVCDEIVMIDGVKWEVYKGLDYTSFFKNDSFLRCIFMNCSFRKVIFAHCDFETKFVECDMTDVEFFECGNGVSFDKCILKGIKFKQSTLIIFISSYKEFKMKIIQNGIEREILPTETIIRGATMYDVYNNIDFGECKFLDSCLHFIRFVNCNFRNAEFDHCRIDASFYACNMRDCRFIQCKVFSISFYHSTTDGMVF